uniref:RING-type domain-containing protein n=1 Tax=Romanomermis culicivorax TaxID=13658 RepID=A0A915L2R4_ROMCU
PPPYNSNSSNGQGNFGSESRLSPVPGSNNVDRDLNFRSRAPPVPNVSSFPRGLSDQLTNLSFSNQPPQAPQRRVDAELVPPSSPRPQSSAKEDNNDGGDGELHDECVICMNEKPDCVLYTCGHLCMCFTCAKTTWQQHKVCPICRKEIKDFFRELSVHRASDRRIRKSLVVYYCTDRFNLW